MGMLQQIEKWSATHHPRWLVFLRVALGISLTLKGYTFLYNRVSLENLLEQSGIEQYNSWLPYVITWLHLICGFFITIGLFTRFSALIMIPILVFAVFFINAPLGLFAPGSEFVFSLLVLLMLVFFLIEGGGQLSMDTALKKYQL
jgi:putative oxidoreductase